MTLARGSIEAALEQLVRKLTDDLIRAALHFPMSELSTATENLGAPTRPRPLPPPPAASDLAAPTQRQGRATTRARAGVRAVMTSASVDGTSRPVPERAAALRIIDRPDDEGSANVITDPGLLLEASLWPSPVARGSAQRSNGRVVHPTALVPTSAPRARPGEEVQRTAGGSVVLRRRGPPRGAA